MNVKITIAKTKDILGVNTILNILSNSPILDKEEALYIFNHRRSCSYHLVAKERPDLVVGTLTMFLLPKYSHGGRYVAYIDDVVSAIRGQKIGEQLIEEAIRLAKLDDCHKIILGCKKELIPYYQKFGFKESNVEMRLDL